VEHASTRNARAAQLKGSGLGARPTRHGKQTIFEPLEEIRESIGSPLGEVIVAASLTHAGFVHRGASQERR
jgi:hypothetical protein